MNRALEVILKEDVQRIFDHFSLCHRVRILFWTPSGEMARLGLNQGDCPYCALLQGEPRLRKACQENDRSRREEARRKGALLCYSCHAGLTLAIKPVYCETSLAGFAVISQFRSQPRIPNAVKNHLRRFHPVEELEASYAAVPLIPQTQLGAILDLFSILLDYIVAQRMISLKGSVALQEIMSYMENHVAEDLSRAEIARIFRTSPSTLSHAFKNKLGKSFKKHLVEMRIAKAEQHMAGNPDTTVAEAAARVGWHNPYYFSRIYKRYRARPPGSYLRQCRAK